MRQKVIARIISHMSPKRSLPRWPFLPGSAPGMAAAMAVACRPAEGPFRELLTKGSPIETAEGVFHFLSPCSHEDWKKALMSQIHRFLSLGEDSPSGRDWRIHSARLLLQELIDDREAQDAVMLLGFGEKVFPVCRFLSRVFFSFHLFDSEEDYAGIQSCLEPLFPDAPAAAAHYLAAKALDCASPEAQAKAIGDLMRAEPLSCSNCGKDLSGVKQPFIADIRLFASKNLMITDEDLSRDMEDEWKKALSEAEARPPDELEKEVCEDFRLFLCGDCRRKFSRKIEEGEIF